MPVLPAGTRLTADALLFDMDGTLVDSGAVVERSWRRWAARHGLDAEALLGVVHGRRGEDTIAEYAPPGADVAAEAAWLEALERADTEGVVPVPGAAALLAALPPARWAVVTSASRALAGVRLAAAGLPAPAVLVGAEDVRRGKPDPAGYRLAAERLGVDPARCVVFEDAPAGLLAGRAAGARVVGVAAALGPAARGALDAAWEWVPDLTVFGHGHAAGRARGHERGVVLTVSATDD